MDQYTGMPERIEGERITLRPVAVIEDTEAILELAKQYPENLERFLFFSSPDLTREKEIKYLIRMLTSPTDALFAIVLRDSENLLGTCGLHDIDRHNDIARLGYILFDRSVQGRGIMREALELLVDWGFRELGLHRIEGNVFVTNLVAAKLDLDLGFEIEGRRKMAYKLNGVYHDVYHIALLREKWEAKQ